QLSTLDMMHIPADNLPAIQVNDHIQVKPRPFGGTGQPADIPAPDLIRSVGLMGGRPCLLPWLVLPATMMLLVLLAQDAVERRLRGKKPPFVGLIRDNKGRWLALVFRLVTQR